MKGGCARYVRLAPIIKTAYLLLTMRKQSKCIMTRSIVFNAAKRIQLYASLPKYTKASHVGFMSEI